MKERYIRQALRKMKVSPQKKKEIARDLEEIFASAAEHGESEQAVMERLGTPEEYAAGISGQLPGKRRSVLRLTFIAATAALSSCFMFLGICMRTATIREPKGGSASIGIIGGADGPTSILVTAGEMNPSQAFLWAGAALLAVTVVQVVLLIRAKKRQGR